MFYAKKSFKSIKSFQNKSLGNYGLLKRLYYAFWDKIKQPFMKHLSTLQNQAIIKLLEKLNEDKRFICN